MERKVYPGEFYRHFKNKLYQIIAVAVHSETGEQMVVYQALYGDFRVYVRPYEMFVSEVDREKYPDAAQTYRFERVVLEAAPKNQESRPAEVSQAERQPNPVLLDFLDAETFEKRMEYLKKLEKTASQADLDSIYTVLDMKPAEGSIEQQLYDIRRYLTMQNRYAGRHLRQ